MSTSLNEERLLQCLRERDDLACQIRLTILDEVGSTMDAAAGEQPPAAGEVVCVIARRQLSGRGRSGRTWASTEGALMTTLAVPWRKGIEDLSGGSLIVGVAIVEAFEKLLDSSPGELFKLKWPNDILDATGQKLCGVLIQNRLITGQPVIMIGVGLNIFESPSEFPDSNALASVCLESKRELPGYHTLVAEVLTGIVNRWKSFEDQGFGEEQRTRWTERAFGIGNPIEIDTGERVISGSMKGVGTKGSLLVETPDGLQEVYSGHVLRLSEDAQPKEEDRCS